jgi:hypothetical protein
MLGALAAGCSSAALADEGGAAFWLSGQSASFAAVPPAPGVTLAIASFNYAGSTSQTLPFGTNLVANIKATNNRVPFTLLYTPSAPVAGGRLSISLTGLYAKAGVTGTVVAGPFTRTGGDTVWGFGDVYPQVALAWNAGAHNWRAYLTGDVPVGTYDSARIANIGLGHGVIDAGGSYTYLNKASGLEASASAGFTGNFKNTTTGYRNGVDFHLDLAAAKFLTPGLYVGPVAYVYTQVTPDHGSAGPIRSEVAGAGVQAGSQFTIRGAPASLNLRSYWQFGARNRPQGVGVFIALTAPLWGP